MTLHPTPNLTQDAVGDKTGHPIVHVVDDDEAIRDSFVWLLEGHGFKPVCYPSAESFDAQFSGRARDAGPCCVLLDVRMPGKSGLELFDTLNERQIAVPVIFVTGHGDVPMAVEAVKKGAFDFIEKPVNEDKLISTIKRAMAHDGLRSAASQQAQAVADRFSQLTPREREVMELVIVGKLNKTIADVLNISIKTVEIHRARVMDKMGAKSLAELVQFAMALKARDDRTGTEKYELK